MQYGDESINMLIDNNENTKFCSNFWGQSQQGNCIITIDLGEENRINLLEYPYYTYYTANDFNSRDPISWKISMSNGGINYVEIDSKEDVSITTARKTQCTQNLFNWNN